MIIVFTVSFEDIQVREVIGRGSFGTVNRGMWNGKEVALKRVKVPGCEGFSNCLAEISVLRFGNSVIHPSYYQLLSCHEQGVEASQHCLPVGMLQDRR